VQICKCADLQMRNDGYR